LVLPFLCELLSACQRFPVIGPRTLQKRVAKSVLGKSDPLTQKKQNFAPTQFSRSCVLVFLPRFVHICKAEAIKQVRCIGYEKPEFFAMFSGTPEATSPKILQYNSFPLPIPLPSLIQSRPVSREMYAKMSFRYYKVSA